MQFSPAFLETLRTRLQLSEIVGRKVALKPKPGGEYLGLCPFHQEKTPSFTVSDRKGFYHCFGCGAHGDAVRFLTETEGITFVEAVTELAALAGMALPKPDKQEQARYEKMVTLYDVTEAACKWYQEQLRSDKGREALSYLRDRNITEQTIATFRLGYAPDARTALQGAMKQQGYSQQQLLDTGLAVRRDNGECVDRFWGRVIFPIMDPRGRVIAFGGRILGEGQPKYINSPETELFHKGRVLYAHHLARDVAYKKKAIVAVEGYMDVIALYQAGIKNAVAPLGTAITEHQLALLWKVAKEPVLCLDGDNAGKRAMARAAELCLPLLKPGYSLQFSVLPKGMDPDDVIRKQGVGTMRGLLTSATMSLADALWESIMESRIISTPEKYAEPDEWLMQMVGRIKHEKVKKYYKQYYENRLWHTMRKVFNKESGKEKASLKLKSTMQAQIMPKRELYEHILVMMVYQHPDLLQQEEVVEELERMELVNPSLQALQRIMLEYEDVEQLQQAIKQEQLEDYIQQLCANPYLNSYIQPGSPSHIMLPGWNAALMEYRLVLMEEEYQAACNAGNGNEESTLELAKQLELQKKLAEKEKMAYEAALD